MMRKLTMEPGYSDPRAWRSLDPNQTFSVVIREDSVRDYTTFIITGKDNKAVTNDESIDIMNYFYPYRKGYREEYTGVNDIRKFTVWPSLEDLMLPWYAKQLEAYIPLD
jgi:hypothetical protein